MQQGFAVRGRYYKKNPVIAIIGSGEAEIGLLACRPMAPGDISRVVEIHLASFPGFFPSLLGPSFLGMYYRGTLDDPPVLVQNDG